VVSVFRDIVGDVHEWLATGIRSDLRTGEDREASRSFPLSTASSVFVDCLRLVQGQSGKPEQRRAVFAAAVTAMRTEHIFDCKKDLAVWLQLAPAAERYILLSAVPPQQLRGPLNADQAVHGVSHDEASDLLGCNEQDSFDDKMVRRDLFWPMIIATEELHRTMLWSSSMRAKAAMGALDRAAGACLEYVAHVARPGSDFSLSLRRFVMAKCSETIVMTTAANIAGEGKNRTRSHELHLAGAAAAADGAMWAALLLPHWNSKNSLQRYMWNCTGRPIP
jgi:hypothetical protein